MFHPVTGRPLPLGLNGGAPQHPTARLKLSSFKVEPLFAYPEAVDVTIGMEPDTDPLGNDDYGDCGVAGPGHAIAWMDARAERPKRVNTEGILAAYNEITGGQDVGVTTDQLLLYWRDKGICGCRIGASLAVDYNDVEAMIRSVFEFGGVHVMFTLPMSVQGKTTWEVPAGDDGGVWGGHWVWAFSAGDCLLVNSWGEWIPVSWAFVAKYAFDARVVISQDDLDGTGRAFSGLDMEGLKAELKELGA